MNSKIGHNYYKLLQCIQANLEFFLCVSTEQKIGMILYPLFRHGLVQIWSSVILGGTWKDKNVILHFCRNHIFVDKWDTNGLVCYRSMKVG